MAQQLTEYEKTTLLLLQAISTHLCAMALGAHVPKISNDGQVKKGMRPLNTAEYTHHVALQHYANTQADKLTGMADMEAEINEAHPPGKPTLAVDNTESKD